MTLKIVKNEAGSKERVRIAVTASGGRGLDEPSVVLACVLTYEDLLEPVAKRKCLFCEKSASCEKDGQADL